MFPVAVNIDYIIIFHVPIFFLSYLPCPSFFSFFFLFPSLRPLSCFTFSVLPSKPIFFNYILLIFLFFSSFFPFFTQIFSVPFFCNSSSLVLFSLQTSESPLLHHSSLVSSFSPCFTSLPFSSIAIFYLSPFPFSFFYYITLLFYPSSFLPLSFPF